ncbi:MAG: Segregation and condensation protein A [Parcubacteria group bacterium GW2011_GWB1_36_5]|nr:MAG: Segregation and condensation protein A [Parcubacteria group bacterium GW2011_GWB1_36_5]
METESYTVKTTGFEGPFGLLLDLIEKRKLFINDVSLASVTEDYLNYMNKLGGLNSCGSTEITSFILIASTLILIKSKSLLPNLDLTVEEEGDIKNLEERNNFGKKIIFAPLERKNEVLVFLPDDQIAKESMMTIIHKVLGSMPKKIFLPEVEVRKVISIEEMISKLTQRIQDSIKINFKDFTGKAMTREEKVFTIVGFLAMLELVRNGILHVVQENNFEDIIITKNQL